MIIDPLVNHISVQRNHLVRNVTIKVMKKIHQALHHHNNKQLRSSNKKKHKKLKKNQKTRYNHSKAGG